MMNKTHKNAAKVEIPEYQTIREIVFEGTARGGDKKQFMFLDREKKLQETNYNQTFKRIRTLSTYFYSKGLTKNKKIAIVSENNIDWGFAYYAIIVGGNVCVPMDAKLSYEDIEDQIIRCDCDAVVYSKKFANFVEQIKANPDVPQMEYFFMNEFDSYYEEGEKLINEGDNRFDNMEIQPNDLAAIVFTSGTTGKSKGVMLTHRNVASNCSASLRVLTGRHAIAFLPLHHTLSWVSGLYATYIVSEWGYLCDGINHIQQDIKKFQPYNFTGVPLVVETVYDRIWKTARKMGKEELLKKGIKISNLLMKFGIDKRRKIFKMVHDNLGGNLDMIICGGAYLDPKYEKGLYEIGIDVFNGYGLTECSPVITCNHPRKFKFGSVGTPLDCNEIKIVDPDENGVGEIYVRGDNVMVGYYNDPEATAEAFDGDWFKTGDFGRIDDEGFLFMVGRKKNLIILSNGKNVSPEEIEEKLMNKIPYIKEVLVYQEGDKILGEFFLNEEDYPDCKDRLDADVKAVNAQMPAFKRVTKISIRDEEFPKTTTLKIARKYHTN
ncbi:MAG: AMP-binding protein [Clostridia bacterium]|nr:AMP-binding protein [Clostridia bacterium]